MTKIKPVEVYVNFNTPWKHQKTRYFMFSGSIKGNTDPKWVKQLQYW